MSTYTPQFFSENILGILQMTTLTFYFTQLHFTTDLNPTATTCEICALYWRSPRRRFIFSIIIQKIRRHGILFFFFFFLMTDAFNEKNLWDDFNFLNDIDLFIFKKKNVSCIASICLLKTDIKIFSRISPCQILSD